MPVSKISVAFGESCNSLKKQFPIGAGVLGDELCNGRYTISASWMGRRYQTRRSAEFTMGIRFAVELDTF